MQHSLLRPGGRAYDQLRPLKVSYDVFGYTASSILFEMGNTKVLCSVTMQPGIPPFLKGTNTGWLTAEYAMLPTATTVRTQRETSTSKRNGRSVEISRLIGRALRSVVALEKLGERSIMIDCDVLQADGGTRTACITGSYFALEHAVNSWLATKQLAEPILTDAIAAISAGVLRGQAILDPDFSEDSEIEADFNFVMTRSGKLIEVQGTAEKQPILWENFDQIKNLATYGIENLFSFFENANVETNQAQRSHAENAQTSGKNVSRQDSENLQHGHKKPGAPLFSLMNRSNLSS